MKMSPDGTSRTDLRLCNPHAFTGFLIFVVLTTYGCTALRKPPVFSAPVPSSADILGLPTVEELLTPLASRRQSILSLRGLARVTYKDQEEKGSARQAVAVVAPDHFRLELFSPIGIAALVATDGQMLAAYIPREKTVYRGIANPFNAARFVRVMLSADQIASLLLGLPLFPLHGQRGEVRFDNETRKYIVTLPIGADNQQIFAFDKQTRLLDIWEVQDRTGKALVRMILADYKTLQDIKFPFEISLEDIQGGQKAAIYYEQVELNPVLPDTLFTLAAIPGVQETNLDAPVSR